MKSSNTVVIASAGSGKTYTLVQQYLFSLLGLYGEEGIVAPSRLLAVTFTEKAAAEMRTRMVSVLMQLRRGRVREDIAQRLAELGRTLPSEAVLAKQMRALINAPIVTFHSYCAQLLREHAFEARMPSNFRLLMPLDEAALLRRVGERVVLAAMQQGNTAVQEVVARWGLHKGAGRLGIVDALLRTHAQIVEHGVDTARIRMASQVVSLEGALQQVWQALVAFEGTADKLTPTAREKLVGIRAAAAQMQVALDGDEPFRAHAYTQLHKAAGGNFGNAMLRKALVQSIVYLGGALCEQVLLPQAQVMKDLLGHFQQALEAEKDAKGAYGFSDLLTRARRLLRENVKVREQAKRRFVRILVDEFQDTSPLQEEIIACLAEERGVCRALEPAERAMETLTLEPGCLLVVGDPKQSIYGFRGADAQIFVATEKKIKEHGELMRLRVCRRCAAPIVDLVNQVAKATVAQGQDGVPFGPEDCMEPLRQASGPAGALWQVALESGDDVQMRSSQLVAERVAELLHMHKPSEIAILVRRIKVAMPLLEALRAASIPARVHGGEGFFVCQEVVDMLAALRLLVEPHDALAWLTVLRSPFVALPDAQLVQVFPHGVTELPFHNLLQRVREGLYEKGVAWAVEELLDTSAYLSHVPSTPEGRQQIRNLEKLVVYCAQLVEDPYVVIDKLWGFVDNPPRESIAEPEAGAEGAVQIMTIHQSKGLEFDVVVLADTWSVQPNDSDDIAFDPDVGLAVTYRGRPIAACAPTTADEKTTANVGIDRVRKRKKERTEAELARLLYVALTRARDSIYILDAATDGERIRSRGLSMHTLLMQAREAAPERFDALLPL